MGFITSGFFRMYFNKEEYKEDIFIVEDCISGRNGSIYLCNAIGHWKSSGKKMGVSCRIFEKYHPELKLGNFTLYKVNKGEAVTYEVPAFADPRGHVHFYNEKEKRYDPGVHKLPLWSFQTFLLLPLPLLLLFNLFKYMLKRKGVITLGLLCLFMPLLLHGHTYQITYFIKAIIISL